MTEFLQEAPQLGNPFVADAVLRALLERLVPANAWREIEPGLRRLGERAAGEMMRLADEAEAQPPRHVPFDAWGRRVDRIETSAAWQRLHEIAAEEAIVATAYERRHGPLSRIHQF
ncbi:MAG TPA: acyl-CoA dehydrogenase, partial [Thermoanaerobaculia bacterium]|nr:acyl-CoA dehydrogenase [Thermoanaerobaculia bacterium]